MFEIDNNFLCTISRTFSCLINIFIYIYIYVTYIYAYYMKTDAERIAELYMTGKK